MKNLICAAIKQGSSHFMCYIDGNKPHLHLVIECGFSGNDEVLTRLVVLHDFSNAFTIPQSIVFMLRA